MEDLIRRSDAIAILEDLQSKHLQFCLVPFRIAIEKVQAIPSADRPQGVYDAIALVNRETEREDLSEEIKKYLFCDLRKKLWGLDSRPQGEWIKDNLGTVICSECKRPRRDNRINHINFCNSCGARMFAKDTNVPNKEGADDELV